MNKRFVFIVLLLSILAFLPAIPGRWLHYAGSMTAYSGYQVPALHPSSGNLRWYRLFASDNGFSIESYYMTTSCEVSLQEVIYSYQHPVDLQQDGGLPTLVLSQAFSGKVYFLQKNDLHLFMTVIDEDLQVSTIVTNNPSLSFENDPLFRRTFCFLTPQLMILSSQGSVYLLNLQTAACSFDWTFPNASGFITFSRLDEEFAIISASVNWPESVSYLLNYQTLTRTQIPSNDYWPTFPISGDFGNDTFLVTQSYSLDWTHLCSTLLMRINANGYASLYPLFYGGYQDSGSYTPMHTFRYVNLLGDNRFLAICTDFSYIPNNERLGIFQIAANSVAYDQAFPALHDLENPSRLYKIQDGYYLSYHNYAAAAEAVRLLDIEAQAITLPDSNLIVSPPNIVTTGDNAFYAVYGNLTVYVYKLVEPEAISDEIQTPPVDLTLTLGPNPFREELEIALSGKVTHDAQVRIYDLRGRLVRKLDAEGGPDLWKWDGKDKAGHRLPSGIYLIRASSGNRTTIKRAVLLDKDS
ncbi:MAG TPA: FlgD immunoglobulin-like domain containing protein [Candidatus Syntrophosphaera sp.]|nr:FlgD immunoglobulin-like domain containing protein [Candidatus Syntrophosphaera sp.]